MRVNIQNRVVCVWSKELVQKSRTLRGVRPTTPSACERGSRSREGASAKRGSVGARKLSQRESYPRIFSRVFSREMVWGRLRFPKSPSTTLAALRFPSRKFVHPHGGAAKFLVGMLEFSRGTREIATISSVFCEGLQDLTAAASQRSSPRIIT